MEKWRGLLLAREEKNGMQNIFFFFSPLMTHTRFQSETIKTQVGISPVKLKIASTLC